MSSGENSVSKRTVLHTLFVLCVIIAKNVNSCKRLAVPDLPTTFCALLVVFVY